MWTRTFFILNSNLLLYFKTIGSYSTHFPFLQPSVTFHPKRWWRKYPSLLLTLYVMHFFPFLTQSQFPWWMGSIARSDTWMHFLNRPWKRPWYLWLIIYNDCNDDELSTISLKNLVPSKLYSDTLSQSISSSFCKLIIQRACLNFKY